MTLTIPTLMQGRRLPPWLTAHIHSHNRIHRTERYRERCAHLGNATWVVPAVYTGEGYVSHSPLVRAVYVG